MKREIKFRAWDGKEMHTQFIVARPQAANVLSIMTDEDFAITQYGLKEWVVMQYTGLKDANGIEIYEGDVLKKIYGSSEPTFEVGWHNERAMWIAIDGYNLPLHEHMLSHCDIIGNIHQNTELA